MIHDVLVTGLSPGTRYFYRVGGQVIRVRLPSRTAPPVVPSGESSPFRFSGRHADGACLDATCSDSVWSDPQSFQTPPAVGSNTLVTALIFGDSGVFYPYDTWSTSYVAAAQTYASIRAELELAKHPHAVIHVGDIAYTHGLTHSWDWFFALIQPIASRAPYMVVVGNHGAVPA